MSTSVPAYASDFKLVRLSFAAPGVLHLEFNRPPVNAFSNEFWREYGAALDRISLDSDVRVVVVSSALTKLFCAGVDLQVLQGLPDAVDPGRRGLLIRQVTLEFQNAISAAERCPYPVIAAVHGLALGLAIDIIAACDIRIASADASFCIKETAVGLAADIGTLARLPKLAGNSSLLHELALTSRNFSSQEAIILGLISRSVPGSRTEVIQSALATASEIARNSPIATLGTKRFIANAREHSVQDALEYQATWNMGVQQAPDMAETAKAAMKKKSVKYEPLAPWVQPPKTSSKL
ncbi:ClpP/crotonase [Peniophora sp. CONT]|nr:ClpP/crotonase [Peniophora sp. CONT]